MTPSLASELNAILICEDLWLSKLYGEEIDTFDDYLKYCARLKEVLHAHVLELLRQGNLIVLDFPGNVPRQRLWFRGRRPHGGHRHGWIFHRRILNRRNIGRRTAGRGQGQESHTGQPGQLAPGLAHLGTRTGAAVAGHHGAVLAPVKPYAQFPLGVCSHQRRGFGFGHGGKIENVLVAIAAVPDTIVAFHLVPRRRTGRCDIDIV